VTNNVIEKTTNQSAAKKTDNQQAKISFVIFSGLYFFFIKAMSLFLENRESMQKTILVGYLFD
jgi:hypothetical protein